jgi:hypothetical protein
MSLFKYTLFLKLLQYISKREGSTLFFFPRVHLAIEQESSASTMPDVP